jgi:hypothetical protein
MKAGDTMTLTVVRQGEKVDIKVILAAASS